MENGTVMLEEVVVDGGHHHAQREESTAAMQSLSQALLCLYLAVPLAGIALNCYVLSRLLKIARQNAFRFETTSGLPLCAMSIGDSICLFAQLSQVVFHFIVPHFPKTPHFLLSFICKLDLYMMHTTSAFSVWSWLVLSVLRYTAVFHPLKYRTIWRQPRNALKSLALACTLSEVWILVFVVYDEQEQMCSEDRGLTEHTVKLAHMMDIIMFYAIPSLLRIFFDGSVLVHCYNPFSYVEHSPTLLERRFGISVSGSQRKCEPVSADCDSTDRASMSLIISMSNNSSSITKKREVYNKKKTAMVMRSIVISVFNLFCNLPSHIIRTWATLSDEENMAWSEVLEPLAQLLYFSQFVCNAFYLSTSIYETTASPPKPMLHHQSQSADRRLPPSRCTSQDNNDV